MKAAPRVGKTHGELVCCAGLSPEGKWHRLYPVSFRTLDEAQKFSRWDIVEYNSSLSKGDSRPESRRIQHGSLRIVRSENKKNRHSLIADSVITSLIGESDAGRSLALIRPMEPKFSIERKPKSEFDAEKFLFEEWHASERDGLFGHTAENLVPYSPAPYCFKYNYSTEDGQREGTCQDWEIEATYLRWQRTYGENQALEYMKETFGSKLPKSGIVFAMGTHKAWGNWLINGIMQLPHGLENEKQERLF